MSTFNYKEIIQDLINFSPRQLDGETKTAMYLRTWLERNSIPFLRQIFETEIPVTQRVQLLADGLEIPCENSSFVGGTVNNADNLISSLISTQPFIYQENINFNPKSTALSLSNFYFAPSVAVAKKDIPVLLAATSVTAESIVVRTPHISENILVGNCSNPRNLIVAHYDSIKCGATDNASGVAVALALIKTVPKTLEDTLYILSGNEELSYDETIYWGHGFRVFEEEYPQILEGAEKIFVVDCVGNGPTTIEKDERIAKLAFPITRLNECAEKIYSVSGDIDKLMYVYHSNDDTLDQLRELYLEETRSALAIACLSD